LRTREKNRHCEERKRRSNPPIRYAVRWIASLGLAMTMELRLQLLSTSPGAPRRYARKDAEAKFARKNFLHHLR
jgi:hypothetical protein